MGLKGIYEALFYTNLNTGELIPWQGESYTYNADFTAGHPQAARRRHVVRRRRSSPPTT